MNQQLINRSSVKHQAIELLKSHWQMPLVSTLIYLIIGTILYFTVIGTPIAAFGLVPAYLYFTALMFVRCVPNKDFRLARIDFRSREFWKVCGANALAMLAPFIIFFIFGLVYYIMAELSPYLALDSLPLFALIYVGISVAMYYFLAPLIFLPYVVIETEGEMGVIQSMSICYFRYGKCKGEIFVLSLSFIGWFLLSALTLGLLFLITVPYFNATMYYTYMELKDSWS